VVADLDLPDIDGTVLARRARALDPFLAVVLVAARPALDSAIAALRAGADDFLPRPTGADQLVSAVRTALARRPRPAPVAGRGSQRQTLVHESSGMALVMDLVARIAPTEVNVLVTGESGVGKDLVARAVHRARRGRRGR